MAINLVSEWADGKTLPERYVYPPAIRPGQLVVPTSSAIPVIDLSKAEGDGRANVAQEIIEAAQQFGFFQVINNGVKTSLMNDASGLFEEFFQLPLEEKAKYYSVDFSRNCILYTSGTIGNDKDEIHNWRDTLRMLCTHLEESMPFWPQQPARFREVAGEYVTEVRTLGSKILELICEGLGLKPGYFSKELGQHEVLLAHYIPPCPDPSLTLAASKHCDPGLITVLLPGNLAFKS